jgi:hypothetical protein
MLDVILKGFEKPDEVLTFKTGRFEIAHRDEGAQPSTRT